MVSNGDAASVEQQRVLVQRAAALARPLEAADRGDARPVLVFTVGSQRYAVDAAGVREVLPAPQVCRVPGAPPDLLGVANVRGDILAVADTGRLLGVSRAETAGPQVLVLDGAGPPLGLVVDEVVELRRVRGEDAVRPPSDAVNGPGDLVAGVTARIVLLDVAALLADRRTFVNSNDDRRADA